ncbi:hypothetical protein PV341_16115 [Streptomyces sp. PA03-1a]|nr:hypothetical protein [Streptomyces sp. PA03-1a]MDX2813356.1 hypothetical protein [Streptomyces sp. PA03-5A]
MSALETLPFVHHPSGMRCSAIRWADDSPPTPMGCRWCGLPRLGHAIQTGRSAKSHEWTAPTPAQIRLRMETRRKLNRAQQTKRVPVLAEKPTGCDGMAHNDIGSEMHCVNTDPDHREDHDDGDGNTWPVQPEEREGAARRRTPWEAWPPRWP